MSDTPRNDLEHGDLAGLSGLYALDALDDDLREQFEAYLRPNPEAQAEVDEFRATAAAVAGAVAEEPPAGLRDRVLAEVATTRQEAPVVDLSRRRARRTRAAWLAVAAAVLLVAGLAGGLLIGRGSDTSSELADVLARSDAAVVPLSGPGPSGVKVVWSATANRAVVVANHIGWVPDVQTMELWAVVDDRPTKVGLFRPDGTGKVRAPFDVDLADATAVGVTVEPAGGSETPTLPMVLQGSVS
jgi:anti-sigma-K factor RskA